MTKRRIKFFSVALAIVAILPLLFCLIRATHSLSVNAETESKSVWTVEDCKEVKAFVINNFERFVYEYNVNRKEDEDELLANTVEYSAIINLIEDNNYGVYFDFDGDNGYAVITGDYNIYALETKGDLAYLRNNDNVHYSYVSGFLYKNETGNYLKYKNPSCVDKKEITYGTNTLYPGQSSAGDGEIDPDYLDEYISARYPNYTFNCNNYYGSLFNSEVHLTQMQSSYYRQHVTYYDPNRSPEVFSEPNCVYTASFNTLKYWARSGFLNVPYLSYVDIRQTITQDSFYNQYGTNTYSGILEDGSGTFVWEKNSNYFLQYMPQVYISIRDYAYSIGGTPSNGFGAGVATMLEWVARDYNNNIDVDYTELSPTVGDEMFDRKVILMSISDSSTYAPGDAGHAVMLLGIYPASYQSGWWIFERTERANFYLIASGWNAFSVIFDPNTGIDTYLGFYYLRSY